MQTFLPCDSFAESALVLDTVRLGRQQVEAWQLLQTLLGRSTGFDFHPAVRMWSGHELSLLRYGAAVCQEWANRGHGTRILTLFLRELDNQGWGNLEEQPPLWLGSERLHSNHRRALLTKDPAHYGRFGWSELPWPTKEDIRYEWPDGQRRIA